MKTYHFLLYLLLFLFPSSIFAQNIINNGSTITITEGTVVTLANSGNFTNASGTLVINRSGPSNGEIIIPGDFINTAGFVDLDGIITLSGNFTNDATNNVFINVDVNGNVVFDGTDQYISNSNADWFIDFERITVNSGSHTRLNAGSAATVNGNLVVNTGGIFRLVSPDNGEDPSGSLITNLGVSGGGDLYVERHFEVGGRYQYVSVPVSNATDDLFDNYYLPNNFNPNLYTYNEAAYGGSPNSSNYSNWTSTSYNFLDAWIQVAVDGSAEDLYPGVGYITYNELELDIDFGGSPGDLNNLSSYSPTVTYTDNDNENSFGIYYDGWNVIGNPYPCAIDAHELSISNINQTIYYWDGDAGNYKYYNFGGGQVDIPSSVLSGGSRYIPAMQAFSMKATAANPSVTIEDLDRVHDSQQMFKSNSSKEFNTQFIKLGTEHNGASDETIVRFVEETLEGFDNDYDAYKMFPSNTDHPTIYSLILYPELPIAINTLPISKVGTTIPLGFNMGSPGSYSISVEDFNFALDTEVKLIDTYLDTETILEQDIEYSFNFDGGENRERFYLFVGPMSALDVDDVLKSTDVNIWSSYNKVIVTIGSYDLIDADIKIVDVLGKTVIHKKLNGTYNVLEVPGSSGTYFVKVKTKDGRNHMDKVFIKR